MAELKTKATDASVSDFINGVTDEGRRKDCRTIVDLMKKATGAPPRMWGESIVGFGEICYAYTSGRELDWFITGFSPRKQNLTLYFMGGFEERGPLLETLGKHQLGKG